MAGTAGIQETLVVYFNQSAGTAGDQEYTLTRSGTVSSISTTVKTIHAPGPNNLVVSRVRPGPTVDTISTISVASQTLGASASAGNIQHQTLLQGDILRFANASAVTVLDVFVSIVPPVAGLVAIA
jgi:hypothetical protein